MNDISFILSILVLMALVAGVRLKVPIISCYYSFLGFSLLNCAYIYIGSTIETGGLSLLEDFEIIRYVILSTFIGLIFFVTFYFYGSVFERGRIKSTDRFRRDRFTGKIYFLLLYFILLIVLIIFAKNYGWHAVSRDGAEGTESSLFAYGKYFFVCMGLFALWYAPLSKKWASFILSTQIILMIFDGGRTTFFGLVVAYVFLLSRNGKAPKISHIGYALLFGALLLATRSLVLEGGLSDGMQASLLAEGVFSGYTALQMADYVRGGGDFLFGLTYFLDPIIYLLPKGVRENYLFIQSSVNNYFGQEQFAPMGGFFWVGEAILNFGFFGGAVVGSMYGYFLARLEFKQGVDSFYRVFIIAVFGCLLAKYNFANGIKIMIFYLGAAFILKHLFVSSRYVNRPLYRVA